MGNRSGKQAQGEPDPNRLNLTLTPKEFEHIKSICEEHERIRLKLTDNVNGLAPCDNQHDVRTTGIGVDWTQVQFPPSKYILISRDVLASINHNMKCLNETSSKFLSFFDQEAEPTATGENMPGGSYPEIKKPRQSVQLYCQREDIVSPFEKSLEIKCYEHDIDLHLNRQRDQSMFSPHELGLVLCLASTRLGTNVKSAMSGIQESNKTCLVILHHRGEHNLPTQPSARLLPEIRSSCLGAIFDMVYLQDRGLYDCPFNTKALSCIVEFIIKNANLFCVVNE